MGARWQDHKHWIREAVRTATPYQVTARQYGVPDTTAYRVTRLPRVQRYIASLHRWYDAQELAKAVQSELDKPDPTL